MHHVRCRGDKREEPDHCRVLLAWTPRRAARPKSRARVPPGGMKPLSVPISPNVGLSRIYIQRATYYELASAEEGSILIKTRVRTEKFRERKSGSCSPVFSTRTARVFLVRCFTRTKTPRGNSTRAFCKLRQELQPGKGEKKSFTPVVHERLDPMRMFSWLILCVDDKRVKSKFW